MAIVLNNYDNQYCDFVCFKNAKTVTIQFNATVEKNVPHDTWTTIANIGEIYRPPFLLAMVYYSVLTNHGILQITPQGDVMLLPKNHDLDAGDYLALCFTYVVA